MHNPIDTGIDRTEFRRLLDARPGPTILQLYALLDDLNNRNPLTSKHACRFGCNSCCKQIVSCVNAEWDIIQQYLLSKKASTTLGRKGRRELRRQFDRAVHEYAKKYPVGTSLPPLLDILEAWVGVDCPFLLRGNCAIYPVRPLICRIVTSTSQCKDPVGGGSSQQRYDYEVEALHFLYSYQAMRIRGRVVNPTFLQAHLESMIQRHPRLFK